MKSEDRKQKSKERQEASQKKQKSDTESVKAPAAKAEPAKKEGSKGNGIALWIAAGVIIIAAILVAAFLIAMPGSGSMSAKFPAFKSNFNAAKGVSIVVYYYNASTYGQETVCSTYLVEVLASHRSPGSINYYTIDNNTCTYIPNGIGHAANVMTNSSSFCLAQAALQPSISMSYGAANATAITTNHLNITGNMAYYKACPVAVEIS